MSGFAREIPRAMILESSRNEEHVISNAESKVRLSVLLSTHNPHMGRLRRTLQSLFAQSLPASEWELVIVDNSSSPPIDASELGLMRHPQARVVREDKLGLIYGRISGFDNSTGEIIVFCDDDTCFEPSYLFSAIQVFSGNRRLGCAVGKSLPEFEAQPASWTNEFFGCLGLWDRGDRPLFQSAWHGRWPNFAGGGGGAVFRRVALADILTNIGRHGGDKITGRAGGSLSSGEDNHIVLSLLKNGWTVGYVPEMVMTHLIPPLRLTRTYLGRLNHGIAKSWVQVLALHGICPWKSIDSRTVPLRKWRAYLRYRAWAGPAEYVRWRGACGHFEGLALVRGRELEDA